MLIGERDYQHRGSTVGLDKAVERQTERRCLYQLWSITSNPTEPWQSISWTPLSSICDFSQQRAEALWYDQPLLELDQMALPSSGPQRSFIRSSRSGPLLVRDAAIANGRARPASLGEGDIASVAVSAGAWAYKVFCALQLSPRFSGQCIVCFGTTDSLFRSVTQGKASVEARIWRCSMWCSTTREITIRLPSLTGGRSGCHSIVGLAFFLDILVSATDHPRQSIDVHHCQWAEDHASGSAHTSRADKMKRPLPYRSSNCNQGRASRTGKSLI